MKLIVTIIVVIIFCGNINAQITFTNEQQILLQDTIEVVAKKAKSKLGYEYLYLQEDTINANQELNK